MRKYKCLSNTEWSSNEYKLVPIRTEDKYEILNWRNSQIEILRQKEEISKEQQDFYFANVVEKLFEEELPKQLLFSFLQNDFLIGYGGLVHMDWNSRNAEISFLTETERNSDDFLFTKDFKNYLKLISELAFIELNFYKLHTTVYDVSQRIKYIEVIKQVGFLLEGHLKKHVLINNQLKDVFIYSKLKIS